MNTILDFHAHLYPEFDLGQAFDSAFGQMSDAAGAAEKVICLVESAEHDFFGQIRTAALDCGDWHLSDVNVVEESADKACLALSRNSGDTLYLLQGYQIATRERLELLVYAPTDNSRISDGLSFNATLVELERADACYALSYGFAKWLGQRGKLIEHNYASSAPVCDTAMRPSGFSRWGLMKKAASVSPMLCGSDPLPLGGQERKLGIYCSLVGAEFSPEEPRKFLDAVMSGSLRCESVGSRRNLIDLAYDQIQLKLR